MLPGPLTRTSCPHPSSDNTQFIGAACNASSTAVRSHGANIVPYNLESDKHKSPDIPQPPARAPTEAMNRTLVLILGPHPKAQGAHTNPNPNARRDDHQLRYRPVLWKPVGGTRAQGVTASAGPHPPRQPRSTPAAHRSCCPTTPCPRGSTAGVGRVTAGGPRHSVRLGSPSWDPLGPNRFTPSVSFWP